jgi:tripartite-type tricarboxylate transporter receptor subunit TctC
MITLHCWMNAIWTALLSVALAHSAMAQTYPTKPVRIVSGFAAGSAGDVIARLIIPDLGRSLGQQVIVEYKPGAGSNIAAEYVARAPADGYTLFLGTSANTINATLSPNLSFDFSKDLVPIVALGSVPNLLVVDPALGVRDLRQFIAFAKSQPGRVTYATPGVGTLSHLSGELLNVLAGIKLLHVPYQGSSQALADVIAGRVSALFGPVNVVWPQVEAGKLKALATTANERSSMAPEVPTMAEAADLRTYDSAIWYGLLAPAGTPRTVVEQLAQATNEALKTENLREQMRKQGIRAQGGSTEDFGKAIQTDIAKWKTVITEAGLTQK